MENEIFDLADKLKNLRDEKKEVDENLKAINAEIEQVEQKLSNLMVNEETQSFNRSGTLFYLTTKVHASAVVDSKPMLYDALKQNGYGSMVYETVNANSLSAFTKEQIEINEGTLPNWMSGLVNVFEKTTVSVRKAK
jgi:hypothetical protein